MVQAHEKVYSCGVNQFEIPGTQFGGCRTVQGSETKKFVLGVPDKGLSQYHPSLSPRRRSPTSHAFAAWQCSVSALLAQATVPLGPSTIVDPGPIKVILRTCMDEMSATFSKISSDENLALCPLAI